MWMRQVCHQTAVLLLASVPLLSPCVAQQVQGLLVPAPQGTLERPSKIFQWTQPIRAGDCRLLAKPVPRLELQADGSLHWHAYVWSRDSNDIWKGQVAFYGAAGQYLTSASLGSIRIPRSGTNYLWDTRSGTSELIAVHFDEVVSARLISEC